MISMYTSSKIFDMIFVYATYCLVLYVNGGVSNVKDSLAYFKK